MRSIFRIVSLTAVLGLSLTGRTARLEAAASESRTSGVLVVSNPTPSQETTTLLLEELWRIGGDSESDDEFFGFINDIMIDPTSGDVYLLDRQLTEIRVFDANGAFLRTIGREGEGPGEFRRPHGLFWLPNGEVGVLPGRGYGIVSLTPAGDPGTAVELPGSDESGLRFLAEGMARGGAFVVSGRGFSRTDNGFKRTWALVRLEGGGIATRYHEDEVVTGAGKVVVREDEMRYPWTVGTNGRVYASLDRDWLITVWDTDGSVERKISLAYDSLVRDAERKEEIRRRLDRSVRFRGPRGRLEKEIIVHDEERDIQWMHIADDGNLWVMSSRGRYDLPQGVLAVFEVFNTEGHWLQNVSLRGDGDLNDDRMFISGNRLFIVTEYSATAAAVFGGGEQEEGQEETEEDPEPMAVICYEFPYSLDKLVAVPDE